jgi:hypothetical protein
LLFQELSDDYMEMREGLDLGYNVNTMLVAVLGNPWFANRYVYWCLSALLLSWPLRVIIEYKTQYADYQVKIILKKADFFFIQKTFLIDLSVSLSISLDILLNYYYEF